MRRAGRYELLEILGRGATATVWRARAPDGTEVAVKEMVHAATETSVREREVLGALACPGVPRALERFTEREHGHDVAYVVLELIEGEPLDRALARKRPTVAEAFAIAAELLEILARLHALGVVHRDVKPENVIRRPDGSLALVDLGSAALARDAAPDARFTASGTIGYMPPEQLAGVVRPENDVYAVGALLVAILSRVHPSTLLDDRLALAWRRTGLTLHPAQARLIDELVATLDRRPRDARALAARARSVAGLVPPAPGHGRWIAIAAGVVGVAAVAIASASAPRPAMEATSTSTSTNTAAITSPPAPARPLPSFVDPVSGNAFQGLPPGPSRCTERGDCAPLGPRVLGLDLDALCARDARAGPGIVRTTRSTFRTTLHGEAVDCTAELDLPYACTVTCRHEVAGQTPDALRARFDAHLRRTRDALGPEQHASVQGLLEVFPREQHTWMADPHRLDLELSVAFGCTAGGPDCATAFRTRVTRMPP